MGEIMYFKKKTVLYSTQMIGSVGGRRDERTGARLSHFLFLILHRSLKLPKQGKKQRANRPDILGVVLDPLKPRVSCQNPLGLPNRER